MHACAGCVRASCAPHARARLRHAVGKLEHACAAAPPSTPEQGFAQQALLGDLNTMAHGIARFSPSYCCDHMRYRWAGARMPTVLCMTRGRPPGPPSLLPWQGAPRCRSTRSSRSMACPRICALPQVGRHGRGGRLG
jgi:hypothetical protein